MRFSTFKNSSLVERVVLFASIPCLKIRLLPRTIRWTGIIIFTLIFLLLFKRFHNVLRSPNLNQTDLNKDVKHFLYKPDGKYISLLFNSCGELSNMMYHYASIYGIGKQLGRIPFIDKRRVCWEENLPELMAGLPELARNTLFLNVEPSNSIRYNWGKHCCRFDNIIKLGADNPDVKYLQISGNSLQSYKYFHDIKSDVRRLMTFSDNVKSIVEAYSEAMFKDDKSSHKLCVHTKLEDFKTHFLQESTLDFTNAALVLLGKELKDKHNQVSVIFVGQDVEFVKQISASNKTFHRRYHLRHMNRIEEMYFGASKCDSLLITASGSTSAWWMGYLRSEDTQNRVYYNVKVSKSAKWEKDEYDFDVFPREWKRLMLTKSGDVIYETRWNKELARDGIEIL